MGARLRLLASLLFAGALALAGAGPALADSTASSNWAGYAVHRSGVNFTRVFGAWTQPSASCTPGRPTYSAMWVGIGGYSITSTALEQIGTEVDCAASGKVNSTAWFELVPAASRAISMRVNPGDAIAAGVLVSGHTVTLGLDDMTTHRTFLRTLHARYIDVSSAEWILEAPADCVSPTSCHTLPLTNFSSATFRLAKAEAAGAHVGAIDDRAWRATRIRLTPGSRHLVSLGRQGGAPGAATPSGLTLQGSSFNVRYSTVAGQSNTILSSRRTALRAGQLFHPGRF